MMIRSRKKNEARERSMGRGVHFYKGVTKKVTFE